MNVVAFKAKKPAAGKGGATLFMHVRQTTVIAHLAAPRKNRLVTGPARTTSRTL